MYMNWCPIPNSFNGRVEDIYLDDQGLARRKATKSNSEVEQKTVAQCHRKRHLVGQNCGAYVGEHWKGKQNFDAVLSSRGT
jgi:hypothetical protein